MEVRERFGKLLLTAGTAAVLGLLVPAQRALAVPVNLGSAADYAVVGVGGSVSVQSDFEIYQSGTVINGNVAEGPYTTLTHGIDATVNGRWDYDNTDAAPFLGSGGSVTGGFVQKDLSPVALDARNASLAAAVLSPTATISTLNSGDVINLAAGLNVIRILNPVKISGGGTTLTINGAAGSSVVFQLVSSGAGVDLTLSGTTMSLTGGITADDIVWNLDGFSSQKEDVTISSSATVYGTILAPDRNIIVDHGNILGRVIGGGLNDHPGLSIHSSSQVTVPTTVPDGGSTLVLLGVAVLGLGGLRGKFNVC